MKKCECGCGQPAPIARWSDKRCGRVKGERGRFIRGHNARGQILSKETKEKIGLLVKERSKSIDYQLKSSKARTGRNGVLSPYLPNVLIYFDKGRSQRWVSKNNGKSSTHALVVYKHHFGNPPDGYVVHHINGNSALLENDNPKNLLAIPAIWNFMYLPALAKGYDIQESEVTKAYIKYYKKLINEALFDAVCYELHKNNKKDKIDVKRKNQKLKLDSM